MNKAFECAMSYLPIFLLTAIVVPSISRHLPSYITACRKGKSINSCAIENGNKALPYIVKGDPDFKIPSFDPYFIPLIETHPSADFLLRLSNLTLKGLDTLHITDMNIDVTKRHLVVKSTIKQTHIDGVYETDGKLFSFVIKGTGPAHIVTDNVILEYAMDFNITSKKGKDYVDVKSIKSTTSYIPEKITYNFENLFGSNKLLGDNFNQLLNDNPKEVDGISQSVNQQLVSQIVFEVFKVLFKVVPYEEIFLDM